MKNAVDYLAMLNNTSKMLDSPDADKKLKFLLVSRLVFGYGAAAAGGGDGTTVVVVDTSLVKFK